MGAEYGAELSVDQEANVTKFKARLQRVRETGVIAQGLVIPPQK